MSEEIKHECGIAFIRLKKPLHFYKEKYGSYLYGLNKLYLLMEKQHNRGQDGAGVGVIKLDTQPGSQYIFRERADGSSAIGEIFQKIHHSLAEKNFVDEDGHKHSHGELLELPFMGELLMGHLRYGTYSSTGVRFCHPFIRANNWMSKNLVLAGNFNMSNNDEIFQKLIDLGQHPRNHTDGETVMEKIGHYLDMENDQLFEKYVKEGLDVRIAYDEVAKNIDVQKILQKATRSFDGGYAIEGMMGHGDAFILRDPNGIRPAYWFEDDELVVATSERPPIKTAFNVDYDDIHEVKPGHALIIKKNGEVSEKEISPAGELKQCSFERIYFSRGTDKDIYQERKTLGKLIAPAVLKETNYDFENTVFSYIPNTAEVAFIGMVEAVNESINGHKLNRIKNEKPEGKALSDLISMQPRIEKIAVKDVKLRTFITADAQRKDLVSHVYDTTYGVVKAGKDVLVAVDDSIVRGTTLSNSILRILDRLSPKKIIIVSSAPQIRYPDCYGIDMSKLKDFIAFKAAIALLQESGQQDVINETYRNCISDASKTAPNYVKVIYEQFTDEQISNKIGQILVSDNIKAEVKIIYQTVENLHIACPNHTGDWYFTGNFPTPGGNKVANKSFVNYYEGKDERAY